MSWWRRLRAHPRAKAIARWLIGIGVLLVLLVGFDGGAVWSRLSTSNLALASIGIVGLTAAHLLAAATWRAICGLTAGVHLPWRATLGWYYAGQALGGVTPGNLGGDVYRIHALRTGGHAFSASVAPVVIQRATSYLALACLGGVALIALASSSHVAMSIVVPAAAVCVLGVLVAAALLVPPGRVAGLQRRLVRLIDGGAAGERSGSRETPGLAAASMVGFVLGLAFHLGCILLTYLLVLAVDPLPFSLATVGAVAVARLSLAVPISPSGLGFQEGALSVLFVGIGLAPEVALAALLLARVSLVFTTLIGVAALALGRPAPGRPAGARNAEQPGSL
jgi:uncharacterized membrane protein YbhN (UPF0104 family)